MEGSNEESDEAGRICGNESWFTELDYAAVIHSPSLSRLRGVSEAGVARRDPESRGGVTILGDVEKACVAADSAFGEVFTFC